MNTIIETKKLCKTFSNGGIQQHVLKNIDLTINEGDFTIIMGASGAGKSTLLYALSGMDRPTLGGHALDNTMQDILIRFKRMQGYEALWQPGTDHAAIATEVKVIEKLKEEGIDKKDLGREKFLERVWDWRKEYGGRIINQLKKLGSSADWDRERFTMDAGNNKAVTEVFCNLYEKGLIYKGSRIGNWCPVCKTSISDAEVVYEGT